MLQTLFPYKDSVMIMLVSLFWHPLILYHWFSDQNNPLGREEWEWHVSSTAGQEVSQRQQVFYCFIRNNNIFLVWHFRLGHPANDVVNRVVRDNNLPLLLPNSVSDSNFNTSILCESCQWGKSKKQSLSASNRVSLSPLKLIHTDI